MGEYIYNIKKKVVSFCYLFLLIDENCKIMYVVYYFIG